LFEFARRTDKGKYEILACCLREGGPYEERLKSIGVPVKNFKMRNVFEFWVIAKIVKFIRENEIDIVNTAVFPADVYGRISARIAGVPTILSTMLRFEDHKQERSYRRLFFLDRFTMPLTTKLIAISETVRKYILQWHRIKPEKVVTLYPGIDVERYNLVDKASVANGKFAFDGSCVIAGTIGRLVEVKGLEYFLESIPQIVNSNQDVRFLIVGTGPLEESLKMKARVLGIESYVHFTGFVEDLEGIWKALDIFVTTSLSEGLPLAVLEAMAMGKPVVATAVGGVREIVIQGVTGILVPPKSPASLAAALCSLLDCPSKRQKMGKKGRQRVLHNFSLDRMVRNYEEFYDLL
jgi:glycosyltransferase involved in cell wall biosynthesis